jgi:hypothetical protein
MPLATTASIKRRGERKKEKICVAIFSPNKIRSAWRMQRSKRA